MLVRRSIALSAFLATVAALLVTVAGSPASATFPGRNGLIAFNRGGNIFTATASGTNVKQITTTGGISGAKWSPDGKSLAYRKNGNILVRSLATGSTVTVASGVDSAAS